LSQDDHEASAHRSGGPVRYILLGILVAGLAAFFYLDLHRLDVFQALQDHRQDLAGFVADSPIAAGLVFVGAYTVVVAFSLPVATLVSVAGGLLFGVALGTGLVVVGATAGATILFLIARSTLGAFLRARAGAAMQRMEDGFRRNEFSYMLILRLIPLFPFFLVNVVPALLGVSLRTYILATAIGIVPGAIVYVSVGAGAGALLDAGSVPGFEAFLDVKILAPIAGLVLLALVPIVYKRFRPASNARP